MAESQVDRRTGLVQNYFRTRRSPATGDNRPGATPRRTATHRSEPSCRSPIPRHPPPNTPFTLIDNTGTGNVAGTFQGLPEGGTLTQGPTVYRITYQGTAAENWTFDEVAGQYYLHRFAAFQPDLDITNPQVRVHDDAVGRRVALDIGGAERALHEGDHRIRAGGVDRR